MTWEISSQAWDEIWVFICNLKIHDQSIPLEGHFFRKILPDASFKTCPSDVRIDALPDVLPLADVLPDVLPDVPLDVLPDVPPDVLTNVPPDVPPDTLPDILPEKGFRCSQKQDLTVAIENHRTRALEVKYKQSYGQNGATMSRLDLYTHDTRLELGLKSHKSAITVIG